MRELNKTLSLAFLSVAEVDVQNPLRLSKDLDDRQLPVPDVMLLARRDYADHPQPETFFCSSRCPTPRSSKTVGEAAALRGGGGERGLLFNLLTNAWRFIPSRRVRCTGRVARSP